MIVARNSSFGRMSRGGDLRLPAECQDCLNRTMLTAPVMALRISRAKPFG